MYPNMNLDGLSIGVHRPKKNPHRGRRLAELARQNVFNAADFKECPKTWPRALAPNEASFFVGVTSDHEMWFDFRPLNHHTHYAAVVVTVQRVNAVSGQKADHVYLEKYVSVCPKHLVNFEADRYCPLCAYKWPAQNYVTNTAGDRSSSQFWLDGWRSQDGEIRQFVFADVEQGLGVAQQLIGDARTEDIRFAIFLSKEPKPIPVQSVPRRVYDVDFQSSGGIGGYFGSSFPNQMLGARVGAPSSIRSVSLHATQGRMEDEVLESRLDDKSPLPTIGVPVKQEVSYGRAVDQQIYADPNNIDFWQPEPAAIFMLTPAPEAWVATVTRNGPTVDRTLGGMGPLAGLKGAG